MSREIPLTKGKAAIVDDEDYDPVASHKWYFMSVGYAARTAREDGRRVEIFMHREIMQAQRGELVDHKDGDGLNCRRKNMRIATKSQNNSNRGKSRINTSGFKGVSLHKQRQKWTARISHLGKYRYLGLFPTKESAAEAYKIAANELHSEFARTEEFARTA